MSRGCEVVWTTGPGRCSPPRRLRRPGPNSNPCSRSRRAATSRCSTGCEKVHTAEALPNWFEHWTAWKKSAVLEITLSGPSHSHARLHALARFANTAKVSVIRRLPESRRLATLVAFASNLEAAALDDALDLLDILITEIFSDAARASDKARLRTIKDLDAAAVQLTQVCRLVLDRDLQDAELRSAIFKTLEREELEAAVNQVDSLVRPPEDVYYRELAGSYARVRRFLPHLLQTIRFDATPAGQSVLEALNIWLEGEQGDGECSIRPSPS